MGRPAIPAAMRRAVEQEAGYRCAVPTCRDKGPFDFEHIDDWAKVKKHDFHNIILLCVGCHARVTRKEISKDAIRAYKRNLAIVSGRYSLFEMRLLEAYHAHASVKEGVPHVKPEALLFISESDKLHLSGLVKDKIITLSPIPVSEKSTKIAKKSVASTKFKESDTIQSITGIKDEEFAIKLVSKIAGLMDRKANYFVMPTIVGIDFINDYFSGKELE